MSFVWRNTFSLSLKKHLSSAVFTEQVSAYQHLWMRVLWKETTFYVKEGWLAKDTDFSLRNILDSHKPAAECSILNMLFWCWRCENEPECEMCNLLPGHFNSKDFEIQEQSEYSVAVVDIIEHCLHINEAVKSWSPKSIWISSPISLTLNLNLAK